MTTSISNLQDRFDKVDKAFQRVKHESNTNDTELIRVENDHDQALIEYENVVMAGEYIQKLISLLTQKDLQPLETLLTRGLNTVFPERSYEIHLDVSDRGNDKTAEFMLTEHKKKGSIVTPARECGYGVQTVISLILQVYYLLFNKARRVMAIDEGFTQIFEDNLVGAFDLIRYLIDELGFDFVGVTHDNRLFEYGDKIYRMNDGVLSEVKI